MAKCEEGYRCDVCGRDVESILESELYLRYLLGEVRLEQLHLLRERHIRCNPSVAQFIVDEQFAPVPCDGPFAKAMIDAEYVAAEEQRITQAWQRLQAIPQSGLTIVEYPEHTGDRGASAP